MFLVCVHMRCEFPSCTTLGWELRAAAGLGGDVMGYWSYTENLLIFCIVIDGSDGGVKAFPPSPLPPLSPTELQPQLLPLSQLP